MLLKQSDGVLQVGRALYGIDCVEEETDWLNASRIDGCCVHPAKVELRQFFGAAARFLRMCRYLVDDVENLLVGCLGQHIGCVVTAVIVGHWVI